MGGMRSSKAKFPSTGKGSGSSSSGSTFPALRDFRVYNRSHGSQEWSLALDRVRGSLHRSCGAAYHSRSLDGGYTWATVPNSYTTKFPSFHWDDARSRLLFIPSTQLLPGYSSVDSGSTWTPIPTLNSEGGNPCYLPTICSLPTGRLVRISLYYGTAYYSDDAGVTWVNSGVTLGVAGQVRTNVRYSASIASAWILVEGVFWYSSDGSAWSSRSVGVPATKCLEVPDGPYKGRFVAAYATTNAADTIRYSDSPKSSWSVPGHMPNLNSPTTIVSLPGGILAVPMYNLSAVGISWDGGLSWAAKPLLSASALVATFGDAVYHPSFGTWNWYHNGNAGSDAGTLMWG